MQAISLFTGAGGLDLGFERAGVDIVLANDLWDVAAETYVMNHPDHDVGKPGFLVGDVKKHTQEIANAFKKYKVDMLIGGPPCQDFSTAGWRTGKGERADMTTVFTKIAVKTKPRWVVMENVNTILSIGSNNVVRNMNALKRAGYGLTTMILNAADFGVPQLRKRFFMIGELGGNDNNGNINDSINTQKIPHISVRKYYPQIARGKRSTRYYYRHPWSFARRGIFSIEEESPTIRGVNRPIPPSYKIHKNDAIDDLNQVRPLTADERAIIQTFPRNYKFAGNKTESEQQIGNSVPPQLAKVVAKSLIMESE